ncbi:MAG: efflux transporter outer membrane subunit, partial [Desulforhopalus sp.]
MIRCITFFLLSALLAISGCTVGPDYQGPPEIDIDSWYLENPETDRSLRQPIDPLWWKNFNDPILDELLILIAQENYSLRIAVAQIERVRGALRVAQAGFFPALSGEASYQRSRRSENSEFGQFPGIDMNNETWQAGFDASWELDLFGRTRRQVESGEAMLDAAVYGRHDALISIQAEAARIYMEFRAAQALTNIAVKQAQLQEETAELIEKQVKEGQASEYQLARIQALATRTRSQIPQSRAQAKAAVYGLALLAGKPPEAMAYLLETEAPLPLVKDPVRVGLPSEMLRRRPDIRQAERMLAARNADIGAAIANLFPSVSLTGRIGFESQSFGNLIDTASRTWLVNPFIQIPLFNRGELRAQIAIAEADERIALLQYEQAVYSALQEAQESLTYYAENLDSLVLQQKSLTHTVKMEKLANIRYRAGEDDLLNLSDAQEQLLQSEQQVVKTRLAALTAL